VSDGPEPPYWKVHHGLGRPPQPRPWAKKGCLLMLWAGLAVVVLALVVGLLLA
jgi:hypothetical protein